MLLKFKRLGKMRNQHVFLSILTLHFLLFLSVLHASGNSDNSLKINVVAVEKGAEVKKIIGGSAAGINASIIGADNEKLVETHRKQQAQFVSDIADDNVKIRAVGVEEGGKVEEVHNLNIVGLDIKADNSANRAKQQKKNIDKPNEPSKDL